MSSSLDDVSFPDPPFSSYDLAARGPDPVPDWLVQDLNALDTDLGVLKTGKEADVHLVRRALPGTDGCLLAAKRYRDPEHRMFHRDVGYQEGRTTRRSRDVRAMEGRTRYGRELLAGKWALAEFTALGELWAAGAPVPYPVQLLGIELMLEFFGDDDGTAAPRLAQYRPDGAQLRDLFDQCVDAMRVLARAGYAHGDLSAFNLLWWSERLWFIDFPQAVDLAENPLGLDFLHRDVQNVCAWFARRGEVHDPEELFAELLSRVW